MLDGGWAGAAAAVGVAAEAVAVIGCPLAGEVALLAAAGAGVSSPKRSKMGAAAAGAGRAVWAAGFAVCRERRGCGRAPDAAGAGRVDVAAGGDRGAGGLVLAPAPPCSSTLGSLGGGPSNAHRRDSYLDRIKDSILLHLASAQTNSSLVRRDVALLEMTLPVEVGSTVTPDLHHLHSELKAVESAHLHLFGCPDIQIDTFHCSCEFVCKMRSSQHIPLLICVPMARCRPEHRIQRKTPLTVSKRVDPPKTRLPHRFQDAQRASIKSQLTAYDHDSLYTPLVRQSAHDLLSGWRTRSRRTRALRSVVALSDRSACFTAGDVPCLDMPMIKLIEVVV